MRRFFTSTSTQTARSTAVSLIALTAIAFSGQTVAQKLYDGFEPKKNGFGQPDLQGTWTNVSLTPVMRARGVESAVYTDAEVAAMENRAEIEVADDLRRVDPDAPATFEHEPSIEVRPEFASAGGAVGGYNRFWLNPGDKVMRVGGEPRTSILTTPNGRVPPRKDGATPTRRRFSQRPPGYIGYEVRGMNDRCIMSFGRNGGPPMFANGFYNNNYQIVQTEDHVMILVEMIHDVRLVRLNSEHRTDGIRPYFGDSIGWYEGDTLVVETTNIPQRQQYYGSWENLKVTERFTRVADQRLHYSFTIEDPTLWEAPWGGEYEFSTLDGQIFEYACHEGNYALPGILKGMLDDAAK